MATLYMMLGYPGAGKTTAAEHIQKLTGAVHLSSDEFRSKIFEKPKFSQSEHDTLYAELDKQTTELLSAGKSVIYDANLNRLQHRIEKYDICKRTGANPKLIWVQTPKDLAKHRATDIGRQHLVPKNETLSEMFDRIALIIEEPGPVEPFTPVGGTKITSSYISQTLNLPPKE